MALFIGCTSLFVASCEREITPSAANGDEMVKGNISLEGIVNGPDGQPIRGATISSSDGNKATTTNAAGQFKMKVAPGSDLKIASSGYSGIDFKLNPKYAKANLSVEMRPGNLGPGNIAISSSPTADGKALNITIQTPTINGETVYSVVENQPEFPGGIQEMYMFLARNIKYPTAAAKANVTGKVFLNFVITTEGEIQDIKILKGIGFGADAEAVRVVKEMPRWKPGMQSGKAVNVRYNLPIAFQIEDGNNKNVGDATSGASVVAIGKSTALVVVDGVEKAPGFATTKIDPTTIQSVDVLKGKSATDKYGDKGADGVIEITLKKE